MDRGDEYVRRLADFIRANEIKLAVSPLSHPKTSPSWLPFISGMSPVILSIDYFHLHYLLLRLEELDLPVGPLDVSLDVPSHPIKYLNLSSHRDTSEVLSLASFTSSISALTSLSFPSYWLGKRNANTISLDLKYTYSCFTKLPAILIKASPSSIADLPGTSLGAIALPLDVFKNLQSLECVNIDPRTLLGWDKLSESLRSLKIRSSGIDDFSAIFVAASNGNASGQYGDRELTTAPESGPQGGERAQQLMLVQRPASLQWTFLRYLSLKENSITSFPISIFSCFTSLTHLDLASNLLISVPPGLNTLHNLIFLDLSDNMIDTVLGIYAELGHIETLLLSQNRLESICGLERLQTLMRVDLRHNQIQEGAEIGRLSILPKIANVWVDGNPFVEQEENYRLQCFSSFWREGKMIQLDGAAPNFFERRRLSSHTLEYMAVHQPLSAVPSVMGQPNELISSSSLAQCVRHPDVLVDSSTKPRRKLKRVVQLDQQVVSQQTGGTSFLESHVEDNSEMPAVMAEEIEEATDLPRRPVRHGRYYTEIPIGGTITTEIAYQDDTLLGRRQGPHKRDLTVGKFEGDKLRTKIDSLRRDVGDGWLKVFSSEV